MDTSIKTRATTMPEHEPAPEPRRSQLRRLLERPDARPRVSRAVASLLAASVVAIAALGGLLIWHLARRARLIREGLGPPRPVRWPAVEPPPRPAPDPDPRAGPPPKPDPGPADPGQPAGRDHETERREPRPQ
jgi:hypothetical protein